MLRILDKEKQKWIGLNKRIYSVGRSPQCDLVIESCQSMIALQLMQQKEESFLLRVLGDDVVSVNGEEKKEHLLESGDVLQVCGRELEISQARSKSAGENVSAVNEAFISFLDSAGELLMNGDQEQVRMQLTRIAAQSMGAHHACWNIGTNGDPFLWPDQEWALSGSAIQTALEKQEVIIWNHSDNKDVDLSRSVIQNEITSILVAPLEKFRGSPESYLYLQRQKDETPFSEADRRLFTHYAAFCAKILANSDNLADLQEQVEELQGVHRENGMLYASEVMQNVVNLAQKAARLPVSVLITGPTGSGKEEMAKYIHSCSDRSDKPFVAVNCGAIPENLIESELFGHVKGAFTGAMEDRQGLFSEANGGTVFLDEVGELPLQVQVKLLRVLQEKKVTPVGATLEQEVDFRLLSATHVDLEVAVANKSFREDLFFRLNLMKLNLPALKDREQDVLLLARHFLQRYSADYGLSGFSFSRNGEKALLRHSWPGNIRELANRIQKALIQSDNGVVNPEHMDLAVEMDLKARRSLKDAREEAERNAVDQALKDASGNLTLAGDMLGVDRKVLRDLMKKLDMDKEDYKNSP